MIELFFFLKNKKRYIKIIINTIAFQTLIVWSLDPLTINRPSYCIQENPASWPTNWRIHNPVRISQNLITLSLEADTMVDLYNFTEFTAAECAWIRWINLPVLNDEIRIVVSLDALTIYLSLKQTSEIFAVWP